MKKLSLFLILVLLVSMLSACGDKPTRRDDDGKKDDITGTVTPTSEPDVTTAPTGEPTATPTPEATATPEATPTPAATATPTPTEAPKMPAVAAKAGPSFAIGTENHYYGSMDMDDPQKGMHVDFCYITTPGFAGLAENVIDVNNMAYGKMKEFFEYVKTVSEVGNDYSNMTYHGTYRMGRSDSVIFSLSRCVEAYAAGPHPDYYRYGHNFDTQTGKSLGLTDMVTDKDKLIEVIIDLIDKNPEYKDSFLDDNWKNKIREAYVSEKLEWVATDSGLEVWMNEGTIAAIAVGEICAKVNVKEYPDLFVAKYVGNYDGSLDQKAPDYSEYHTVMYNTVVRVILDGLRTMTWKDVANLLASEGYQFEGEDDEEASLGDYQPYITFTDETSGYVYSVDFWPLDKQKPQQAYMIWFLKRATNIYASYSEDKHVREYVMVDPWIHDDYEDVAGVRFTDPDAFGMVVDVTIPYYYEKRYE